MTTTYTGQERLLHVDGQEWAIVGVRNSRTCWAIAYPSSDEEQDESVHAIDLDVDSINADGRLCDEADKVLLDSVADIAPAQIRETLRMRMLAAAHPASRGEAV